VGFLVLVVLLFGSLLVIAEALRACGGNKAQAAKRLGLSRQGLLNKLRRYEA
jgi:DNA-binding NtrC family response regulator